MGSEVRDKSEARGLRETTTGARGPFTGVVGFVHANVICGGKNKPGRSGGTRKPSWGKPAAPSCKWRMNVFKSSKAAPQSSHWQVTTSRPGPAFAGWPARAGEPGREADCWVPSWRSVKADGAPSRDEESSEKEGERGPGEGEMLYRLRAIASTRERRRTSADADGLDLTSPNSANPKTLPTARHGLPRPLSRAHLHSCKSSRFCNPSRETTRRCDVHGQTWQETPRWHPRFPTRNFPRCPLQSQRCPEHRYQSCHRHSSTMGSAIGDDPRRSCRPNPRHPVRRSARCWTELWYARAGGPTAAHRRNGRGSRSRRRATARNG